MILMHKVSGFSLVEILVSLFIVSLAALSISGLQTRIQEQNRDNYIYADVLKLATEKMDDVLQYTSVTALEKLPTLPAQTVTSQQTNFTLSWRVAKPAAIYDAGENVRDVELQIDWLNSKGQIERFSYRELVNLAQLLDFNDGSATSEAGIIESFLQTNQVDYFEAKMDYKKGAFVIYNSELFKVTSAHSQGVPRNIDNPADVVKGWTSYGLIDNPDLAALF